MKTMRLPTINPQSQQQPGRLPQTLSTSGSTCKTAFGGASSNLTYEQPFLPAFCSKPVSTTSICSVSGKQSPSLLGLYRSTMNQFRVQQYAFVASLANKSSNAREQMLKRQLMKAVMKHQPGLDYLDFLRKYAEDATSSNSTTRQEFDYLDYIRRDAAEEFRRNGVEVTNFEGFRITDGGRSLGIAQVGDSNLPTATSTKDSYGKGRESTMKHVDDSAIISYGDFTTTSMSNHEPQESSFETYNASPKKSEIDFSAKKSEIDFAASQVNGASRNRRNIFRNSHSHRRRRSSSRRRQESSERPRSRPGKNVPPAAASTTGRRPRRSKPYDGASQRGGRPAAASNPNEKQESYVSSRTTNPSTPDHSSKIPRSTTR